MSITSHPAPPAAPHPTPVRPSVGRRVVLAVARRPWTLLALVVLALFGLWVASTRTQSHHVRAVFPAATNLVPGLDVQVHGIDVGKISSVEYVDGHAVVGLGIDDDSVWPLRRGTTATIRYGTTVGNGTRRVDLVPGPKDAPDIGEGGIITARHTRAPVEFDEIFRMMDRDSREHMRSLTGRTAETLEGRAGKLNDGIRATAPALESAGGLLSDLAADQAALRALITDTHRAAGTLSAYREQVADLVSFASKTFATFAANTSAIGRSIELAPDTLKDARGTLARLDSSVDKLEELVADARPAAAELPGLAADARPAVARLARTAPIVTDLLRTGRRTAPDITALLTEGAPFAKRLTPILDELAPMLGCLRPYMPELAGAMSNWASYGKNYDNYGHYARMNVLGGPTSLTSTPQISTATVTETTGLRYAMPRPPGLNEGKPWFLPECGAGPDALDPTKDPEDR